MDHNKKYLSDDVVIEKNQTEYRKAKYLRFMARMTQYPAKPQEEMPTDKEQTLIWGTKNGLIPWFHPGKDPDEWMERRREKNKKAIEADSGFAKIKGPWSQYFYTNFFSTAPKLILLSKAEIQARKEDWEEDPDVSHLPQDGSRGQARACRKHKKLTAEWFLGEWDGSYTEWENKPKYIEEM